MQIDAHLVNFMANFIYLIKMTKEQLRRKQNRHKINLKSQGRKYASIYPERKLSFKHFCLNSFDEAWA